MVLLFFSVENVGSEVIILNSICLKFLELFFMIIFKKKLKKLFLKSEFNMKKNPIHKEMVDSVKALEGIYRKTLAYNDKVMLCSFILEKDAEIPLHNHEAHQIGYVIKGKIQFITESENFIAQDGDSYVFDSYEKHGAKILENAEVIEMFYPTREDYK